MGIVDKILGTGGEVSEGVVQDLYENVETDIDYSPERAAEVARKASVYVEHDEQGAVSMHSSSLSMDQASETALRKVFGNMLFGDDRKNRERPKMIRSDVEYEEIGAATIGAGLAAAKVDEVGHTPYGPDYEELFCTVVEDGWNQNPDVTGDFHDEVDHYAEIVQETAENVEEQMLEIRPENDLEHIDRQLEQETEKEEEMMEKE